MSTESPRRVAYYYDPDVGAYTFGLHQYLKPHRTKMTHDLVSGFDMLGKMHVLVRLRHLPPSSYSPKEQKPKRATAEALTAFHTDEYIQFLSKVTPETFSELSFNGTRFLVGEDNPPFEGLFEFSSISAGGSIDRQTALEQLSELRPAPSVGLQDVPRVSLAKHLFPDALDRQLSERLQEAAAAVQSRTNSDVEIDMDVDEDEDEDESDDEDDDNSASRSRARKIKTTRRHMSIVTNQYQDRERERESGRRRRFFDLGVEFAFPTPTPTMGQMQVQVQRAMPFAGR
ncbi:Hist-deacetyl domain-containing protein [Mycena chlorophos]|uniref:Hist-deacetyl domain-containing protein n=1 Tax=Mycena chlorophos TaxID=658473 RepID=A0A8H6SHX1_MYCCL|nr:Hist-deacetyl domain-containing protein [Mycena chlorophos]